MDPTIGRSSDGLSESRIGRLVDWKIVRLQPIVEQVFVPAQP